MSDSASLYLDLMKRCLVNWIYSDAEPSFEPYRRVEGLDFPPFAHTLIGMKRLDSLQRQMEQVLREKVPGDFMETGVWRGGAVIFMRAALKAHGITDRKVWVADSFEGLPLHEPHRPLPDEDTFLGHEKYEQLAVSLETVRGNFERYGLLDDQVRFVKGWFRDTLPKAEVESLAILRLDGDLYESTRDALTSLYPKLSKGGFITIDDYGLFPPCKEAVDEYRKAHGIQEPIETIDKTGVFWRRLS